MVRDGIPFVLFPLAAAAVLAFFGLWWAAVPFIAAAAFMAYFFRDPHRDVPTGPGLIVSAADGRVTRIEDGPDRKVVSVFLSPLDVHINRSPIAGRIKQIQYTVGKKTPAADRVAPGRSARHRRRIPIGTVPPLPIRSARG